MTKGSATGSARPPNGCSNLAYTLICSEGLPAKACVHFVFLNFNDSKSRQIVHDSVVDHVARRIVRWYAPAAPHYLDHHIEKSSISNCLILLERVCLCLWSIRPRSLCRLARDHRGARRAAAVVALAVRLPHRLGGAGQQQPSPAAAAATSASASASASASESAHAYRGVATAIGRARGAHTRLPRTGAPGTLFVPFVRSVYCCFLSPQSIVAVLAIFRIFNAVSSAPTIQSHSTHRALLSEHTAIHAMRPGHTPRSICRPRFAHRLCAIGSSSSSAAACHVCACRSLCRRRRDDRAAVVSAKRRAAVSASGGERARPQRIHIRFRH